MRTAPLNCGVLFIQYILKLWMGNIAMKLPKIKKFWDKLKTQENSNNHKYLSLTPNTSADSDNAYSEMLAYALSESAIKNIAVTGPYGSGKSSVLLTFQHNNPNQWHYLNISLATFKDNFNTNKEEASESNDQSSTNKKLEIEAIEKSILQQLFYSVEQGDLPRSRLKRIVTVSARSIFGAALFFLIWLLCGLVIFNPENQLYQFAHIFNNPLKIPIPLKYYSITIFSSFSFALVCLLFQYAEKIQELKLKFQDTELTLANQANDSILNTYLDEILYFFEKTKFNVVVIEDLDRFDDPEIFIRLRELNTLINSAKQIKRRIIFVYAIKDSMFMDKDRTKFFDFIVPIIPIINPTNAYDFIRKNYINDSKLANEIDDTFLHQVSLYFDDMRLVINIFNEFNLYAAKLKNVNLDKNKLLALIIYKNYHPHDFSSLHSNEGAIYDLFHKIKPLAISNKLKSLDQKIQAIQTKIDQSQAEKCSSITELRRLYLSEIYRKTPKKQNLHNYYRQQITINIKLLVDNKEFELENLYQDSYFEAIQSANRIEWFTELDDHTNNQTPQVPFFTFKQIEKIIDESKTYKEREIALNDKSKERRNKLLEEKNKLLSKIDIATHVTLKEIIDESKGVDVFDHEIHTPLLRFLVREGHITERYPDYISFFIESVINLTERDFARRVLDKDPAEFETKLVHIDKIISKFLPARQFTVSSILNFDLMDYIIINRSKYSEHYRNIFALLSDSSDQSIDFIFKFIKKDRNTEIFINQIICTWSSFWSVIATTKSTSEIDDLLKVILGNVDLNNISNLNNGNLLSKYISTKPDFISFMKGIFPDMDRPIHLLTQLKPCFTFLECSDEDIDFFNQICEFGYYDINTAMIDQIILMNNEAAKKSELEIKLKTAPYTTLQESAPPFLISQIEQSIVAYINNVILDSENDFEETEENLLALLNHESVYFDQEVQIIEKSITKINLLNNIDNERLWKVILDKNKAEPTWSSLLVYYESTGSVFDETIISFLNRENNYTKLALNQISANDFSVNYRENCYC